MKGSVARAHIACARGTVGYRRAMTAAMRTGCSCFGRQVDLGGGPGGSLRRLDGPGQVGVGGELEGLEAEVELAHGRARPLVA